MCGQLVAIPIKVVEEVIRDIERNLAGSAMPDYPVMITMPDYPATRQSAFPGAEVAIIVPDKGFLRASTMTWGYEASWATIPALTPPRSRRKPCGRSHS